MTKYLLSAPFGAVRPLYAVLFIVAGIAAFSTRATAELDVMTYRLCDSVVTTTTGIRGENMIVYFTTGSGGNTGGLLFGLSSGVLVPGSVVALQSDTNHFPDRA